MNSNDPHNRPVNPNGPQAPYSQQGNPPRPRRGQPAVAPGQQAQSQPGRRPLPSSPHHPRQGQPYAPPVSAQGARRPAGRPATPQRNPHAYEPSPSRPQDNRQDYYRGPYAPKQEVPYYDDPDADIYANEYDRSYPPANQESSYDPYDQGYRPARNTLAGDPYEEENRSWTRWLPTIIAGLICVICVILLLILLL